MIFPRHPVAHLRRGLAGEGDGDDLLGMIDRGEEAQVALDEQSGLAGSGRRLHDEGARRIQGGIAHVLVGGPPPAHRS
jgi:hypothetical protein